MTLAPFHLFDALDDGIEVIEASAGTGKTYSIAALVVRLIAERDEVTAEKLLVVTFTRAATAELADRIRARLFEASSALRNGSGGNDEFLCALVERAASAGATNEWARRLERARANLDAATITTIHSFAHRALQWFALEAGHDTSGEPLDRTDALVQSLANDLQLAIAGSPDEPFNPYLFDIPGIERKTLLKLTRAALEEPRAEHLPPSLEPLTPEGYRALLRAAWQRFAVEARQVAVPACVGTGLATLQQIIKVEHFRRISRAWPGPDATPEEVAALLSTETPTRMSWALSEALRSTAVLGKLKGSKAAQLIEPMMPLLAAAERLHGPLRHATSCLLAGLIGEARARAAAELARRGASIHSGALVALADAIESPDRGARLRKGLGQRFSAVLIDEFQDTDALQWTIFERTFGQSAIVRLIGDPKQAIYRFRGADFRVYDAAVRAAKRRSTMTRNFRSDARLIDALNVLLGRPGVFRSESIEYVRVEARHREPTSRLRDAAERDRTGVEFRIFDGRIAGQTPDSIPGKTQLGSAPEKLVAADIARLLESGCAIHDGEDWRPVRASDIAVLVDTNAQAEAVRRHLSSRKIPAVTRGNVAVFGSPEAKELLQLLRAMRNPMRRVALKQLAAGMLFGWSADQIRNGDDQRWNELAASLRQARIDWDQRGLMAAVYGVFNRHAVEARVLGRPGGERSLTNLHHLLELLHRAASEEKLGPDAVASWLLANIRRSKTTDRTGPDDPAVLRLETDAAAVQVMTVHASKGLEFGIVYLPRLFGVRGGESNLLGERLRKSPDGIERGIWCDLSDAGAEGGHYAGVEREESLQEEARKLYVAVTRARHRLVVYAGLFTNDDAFELVPDSPLWMLAGDEARPEGWPRLGDDGQSTEGLERYLRAVAGQSGGVIEVSRVDDDWSAPTATATVEGGESLAAAVFGHTGDLRRGWGMLSFSMMARALKTHARSGIEVLEAEAQPLAESVRDRDDATEIAEVESEAAGELGPALQTTTAFDALRAGRTAGDVIHAVLEEVDFAEALTGDAPAAWTDVLVREAARHGVRMTTEQAAALCGDLARACRAEIDAEGHRFSLASIAKTDRRCEMEFTLPLLRGGMGDVHALRSCLAERADDPRIAPWLGRLRATPLAVVEGMLTGFIDLVCAVPLPDGTKRYFVVDYKTNRLHPPGATGSTSRHYAPEALRGPMADHHYVLQYHLYLVALHRLLRHALGERYDYDRHVGGAAYLFLRGMALRGAPDQTGIFFDRPPRVTIERLSALFDGRSP